MAHAMTTHLDVVSAEQQIFSGRVSIVEVTGQEGELGIMPGHAPLITPIKPGMVRFTKQGGQQEVVYLSGGIIEVQPSGVIILADTAIRGEDLDVAKAKAAVQAAEQHLNRSHGDFDFTEAQTELAKAMAQLRVIDLVRSLGKR